MHSDNHHSGIHGLLVSCQQRQAGVVPSPSNSEIEKIRAITRRMLDALDEYTQQASAENPEASLFWSNKETPLSVLVKLTQVLARLPDAKEISQLSCYAGWTATHSMWRW